jgi:electron transfer flavoprotein alpha subunit
MSRDIYVIAEQRDGEIAKVSFELIGEATKLAADLEQKVVGILMGDQIKDKAQSLIEAGADSVVVVEDKMLAEYVTEPYAKALTAVIKECDPEILLFGATSIGRDLAPRVASRVHTGLTADCTKLDIDVWKVNAEDPGQKLLFMTRPAFGGNIMATILCKHYRPQMATVRPGVMKRIPVDHTRTGEIKEIKVEFKPEDMNIVIREVVKEEHKNVDITEAKCLISGGRGIGSPEFYGTLQEVASIIGGEISSSRANVDAGWIARERQVGQTGKTVRPELYMACGISGAIQHVAGMEGSEYIIAINKNDTAAIFDVADLGIVGDVRVIMPKLVDALKKYKTANA